MKKFRGPKGPCEFCEGNEWVFVPEYDTDAHQWAYTKLIKCVCVTGIKEVDE